MRTTTTKKTETGEEVKAVTRVAVPSKMTAAVLYGSEDLRIEKIDVPALAADEVLLRVRLALTDGTDLKVWKRGYHAKMIQPPAVFGHELVGEIVAVGKRVDSRWRIGMRVVAANSAPCLRCYHCRHWLRPHRIEICPHAFAARSPRYCAGAARRSAGRGTALGGGGRRQRYGNIRCRGCRESPYGRPARSGFGGGSSRESRNVAAGSRDGPPRGCCQFLQRPAFGHARGNRARGDSLFGDQAHLAFPPYPQVLPRGSGSHSPRRHLCA